MKTCRARKQRLASCVGLSLFLPTMLAAGGQPGDSYRRFTHDGVWCWFADPRAVHYEGTQQRTYAAWVNSQGDIVAGVLDVIPMVLQGLTWDANLSAFFFGLFQALCWLHPT